MGDASAAMTRDDTGRAQFLFALVRPDGSLAAVVDADTGADAWRIATGWDDDAGIEERARKGWRLYHCHVAWNPQHVIDWITG